MAATPWNQYKDCGRIGFLRHMTARGRQCHSSSRFQSDTASFLISSFEFSWALFDGCCLMHARILLDIGYRTSCAKLSGTAQELSTYNHLSMHLELFVPFFGTCIWSDHTELAPHSGVRWISFQDSPIGDPVRSLFYQMFNI
jgi:hypothetical protein